MRWGALFDDFEAQLIAAERRQLEAQVDELARAERSALTLADRLRGQADIPVDVLLRGGLRFRGSIVAVAETWFSLETGTRTALVPMAAVVSVSGLGRRARLEPMTVRRTLSFASALRALARDRSPVACYQDGRSEHESLATGIIDAVGGDYFEITSSGVDGPRTVTAVSFGTIVAVASLS